MFFLYLIVGLSVPGYQFWREYQNPKGTEKTKICSVGFQPKFISLSGFLTNK
uniref:Uncharacterized protein n=1 Tax=Rhizophagus irregularis (strain DAOM 181602 / DAOM 197198 / MUCL 43194) TaxID=747089 RepID=U9SZT1_RHIID